MPEGRAARWWLLFVALEAAAVAALAVAGAAGRPPAAGEARLAEERAVRELAADLGLTDLALWPAASYTRHPSQADLFAPHAEHPAAPELAPQPWLPRRRGDP